MRDTLKIVLTKLRLDTPAAVESLPSSIRNNRDLAKLLKERQSGFSYAYEEESRAGRYIASNGTTVMIFSIACLTSRQAASIAGECERIAVWNMYEIRKAADRALGASLEQAL
ncbi:MAG: hypothetical protein ACLPX1_16055 [Steroidobacteraceae bacterium]